MLSDSLSDLRRSLLDEIAHYSDEPWEADYPNSQKKNLILALFHLQLAQMAFEYPNHVWSAKDKSEAMIRAENEFNIAVACLNDIFPSFVP